MASIEHSPPPDDLRVQDLHQERGWIADKRLRSEGWTIEHLTLPPDQISVPALSEHVLVVACNRSERQVNRFAAQEYDGTGYKNYFFIVPAGTPAEFAWESEDSGIVFGIDPQVLRRTATRIGYLNTTHIELKPLVFAQDEQVTYLSERLMHEIRTGDVGSHLYIESLLLTFSIHLLRHYCTLGPSSLETLPGESAAEVESPHSLSSYKLRRVLEYIEHNLSSGDTSLDAISQIAELSTYYFARKFKESTGLAPHQYVTQQRIEKAKRLLKDKTIPIFQVATDCGFSNQSHLGRVFRQATGKTPRVYRQQF